MPNELKPCPFCGGDIFMNEIYHRGVNCRYYRFLCKKCGVYVVLEDKNTEKEAKEFWNRRVDNG